jgi:hypothetical protein
MSFFGRQEVLIAFWTIGVSISGCNCGRNPLREYDAGLDEGPVDGSTDLSVERSVDSLGDVSTGKDVFSEPDAFGEVRDSGMDAEAFADADSHADVDAGAVRRPYKAIAIATGTVHSCALLDDHKVKCWGDNSDGQLGLGDDRNRGLDLADMGDALPTVDLGTDRTATAIAAGHYATCAILDNGDLKCWGLGSLTGLSGLSLRGNMPGQMGDNLPAVPLGLGKTAVQVAVGFNDACVLRDDGTVRCWGTSSAPAEVPVDGTVVKLAGASSVLAMFSDGSIAKLAAGVQSPPPRIDYGGPARDVSGGRVGSCVLFRTGGIGCSSNLGPTGIPPAGAAVSQLALSETAHVCGIMTDGTLRSWTIVPSFLSMPTNDVNGGVTVDVGESTVAMSGGAIDHTCVLLASGDVKCWSWSGDPSAALGGGPNGGISGTSWSSVDLGTRVE